LTVDELVQMFIDIASEQVKAELHGDLRKMRALYWKMDAVENELRARPGDQRKALVPLRNARFGTVFRFCRRYRA
jgi:hypothetical protein